MKKVMIVFGTRPEAIKMAPLCLRFLDKKDIKTLICVTGQHREMLDQVLSIFNVVPDIDLNIMKQGQDLFDVTSSILLKIKDVLLDHNPDMVLVHGDTTTAYATALACFYYGVKIGHVEAGLRTYNMKAPFPEEFNRQSIGLMADMHFTPTSVTKNNLICEGKNEDSVVVTGNTVIDALHIILKNIETDLDKSIKISSKINKLLKFDTNDSKFVLITGHRRENFGAGFLDICEAIKEVAIMHPDIYFVYPVHLNPNVQEPVNNILSNIFNVILIKPLAYEEFVFLLKKSYLVLTDSGGIQEEAPSIGKPVLVLRDTTERPEAVSAGTVKLVGSSKKNIVKHIDLLLKDKTLYKKMSHAHNPYGNGKASDKIIEHIRRKL